MDKNFLSRPINTLFQKDPKISFSMQDSGDSNAYMINTRTFGVGTATASSITGSTYNDYYWDYWQPYQNYFHSCYNYHPTSDKFETAFKLARKLMDKKLVKPMKTIEDFFKLMDSIVETL